MSIIEHGFNATASTGGASTWRDEWLPLFTRRKVNIVMDADRAGVKAAERAARAIYGTAKEVRIVTLPYELQEKHGKDLFDYTSEHTKEDFLNLIKNTPVYEPKQEDYVIMLMDDMPDTVAIVFEAQSKVAHKYNRFDGWSIFHNGKYQPAEDVKEIRLHLRKFLGKCRTRKVTTKKTRYVRLKQTSSFVSDVIESLSSLPDVHILPSRKAPCSLDGTVDPQHIIAANNVLIDISKRPHITHPITDQFYTLNYLTYDYIKDAFSEKFAKFLVDITKGDIDLMILLQQWCGYLLLPTLKYQKFLLCVGDGANGKGVFFYVISAALGFQNVSNVPLARFESSAALFATHNKLANMSNENAKNLTGDAESILKEYVAGDKILWEQKYHDAFFDYPTAKLMFATNELPKIRDATDGIWRRMILVPFDAKFEAGEQNPNLGKELQQPEELAGVLNWMIEGAEMLTRNGGFITPERCKVAVEQYRDESNSARLFLKEMVEFDTEYNVKIPCTWLHQQYQDWCKNNGFKPLNNVHFAKAIWTQYRVQKTRPRFGERKLTAYLGIKPQADSELDIVLRNWTWSGQGKTLGDAQSQTEW